MPEFILNTAGNVRAASDGPISARAVTWRNLDAFTQGYIEALFFTESAPGVTSEEWQATEYHDEGSIPGDVGFSDLAPDALTSIIADCAPDALTSIIADCAAFRQTPAWLAFLEALGNEELGDLESDLAAKGDGSPNRTAGRDFWYTRCGHGCGYWDGDYPEPHATALSEACDGPGFGNVDSYLGDDGLVYLS